MPKYEVTQPSDDSSELVVHTFEADDIFQAVSQFLEQEDITIQEVPCQKK